MFQTGKEKDKAKTTDYVENAVSDFKSGKNEMKRAARSSLDDAEGTIHHLRDQAREVGEKVQHFMQDRREQLLDARVSAERTIRANPLATTAAAFVGGLILARLLRRI